MFLGSMIQQKRIEHQLTQTELAHAICTQNTISKIEKHNIAPTVNILIKLCLRLDVTLNDVFTDFNTDSQTAEQSVINDLEKLILRGHSETVSDQFKLIKEKNVKDMQLGQYFTLQGAIQYLDTQYDDATFTLDKVLQQTKSDTYNIYTILAYLYEGMSYLFMKHPDRAQYYFQLATDAVADSIAIPNANIDEKLFVCKTLAEYYLSVEDSKKAKLFTNRGFAIIEGEQQTPFVSDFYHLRAVQTEDKKSKEYRDNVEAEKFFKKISE